MNESVVVYHNPCGRLVNAERDPDTGAVTLPGQFHTHPECGRGWNEGYDVLGPVTVHDLASDDSAEVPATPQALTLAADLGLDPAQIEATGAGGKLTFADVERAFKSKLVGLVDVFNSAKRAILPGQDSGEGGE
jgi:pyruvate/2-oxoglutarate dehydrogenase complex dihydrolipoamide acyltransferase (E2) component